MFLNKLFFGIVALALTEPGMLNCGSQYTSDRLKAISLIKRTPLVNKDNSLAMMENYYSVYYYDDFVMYKIFYEFDSLVNGETMLQEIRSYFVAFHKDSSYAYIYVVAPNAPVNDNQRVNKDSLLRINRFETDVYDTLINYKPDSIYDRKDEIIKVYKNPASSNSVSKEKHDLYFYYTKKLKDVPETFSQKMDNIKGMKLTKILIKVSGGYYKEFNMTFPPRELLQEMAEIAVQNKDEILGYFRRYKEGTS